MQFGQCNCWDESASEKFPIVSRNGLAAPKHPNLHEFAPLFGTVNAV